LGPRKDENLHNAAWPKTTGPSEYYQVKTTPHILAIVLPLLIASQATAVTYDQVDDFQDPADGKAGWRGGIGFTAQGRAADGGPEGVGDAYLRVSTRRYHLATKNTDQWAGNYLAARIGAIEMDLNHINPGSDAVEIRILIFGPGGAFASANLTSPIPANTWQHYRFGLTAADLVHVTGGTGDLMDTLSDVRKLLIRHDRPEPTIPGEHPPHITERIGIDNIHAVPAPVDIDIKPGSDTNALNPLARGVIPVAILGSATFDVADVDVTTLAFGPSAAASAHGASGHWEDVNGDGFTDLVSHYRTEETGIAFGDTEACVSGETLDSIPFDGCDLVKALAPPGKRP
jgi:hypothetical protein